MVDRQTRRERDRPTGDVVEPGAAFALKAVTFRGKEISPHLWIEGEDRLKESPVRLAARHIEGPDRQGRLRPTIGPVGSQGAHRMRSRARIDLDALRQKRLQQRPGAFGLIMREDGITSARRLDLPLPLSTIRL